MTNYKSPKIFIGVYVNTNEICYPDACIWANWLNMIASQFHQFGHIVQRKNKFFL